MTKYSTGGGGGTGGGDTCELCGQAADTLRDVSIAGAQLSVCPTCEPHDDRGPKQQQTDTGDRDEASRRRRAAQQTARMADAQKGDADYWVRKGTDYESDPLPYLVSSYGDNLESARQDAGLTHEELAELIDASVQDIEAVEQNRAARAGVGGSVIRALETELDITLVDES